VDDMQAEPGLDYGRKLTRRTWMGSGREPIKDARGCHLHAGDIVAIADGPRHGISLGVVLGEIAEAGTGTYDPRVRVRFGDGAVQEWWPEALAVERSAAPAWG
jgi:hypothetical protein